MQEASLLMAKLNYVEGNYREALSNYFKIGLDDLQLVGIPVYRLSMIAEAYATKGLCLEKVPMASPVNRHTGGEQEIITCYEKSGDIALLYLQEVEKALSSGMQNRSPKPGPVSHEQELGFFLETGLQRAHVIYFKNGIFCPQENTEEALLLLLISESMCLERAMKFAFEEFHLWYQFALSLMAAGKLEEGERFAKMVIDMGEKASEFRAKGYLAIGLVYSLKATDASLRGVQEEYQRKALGAFQRAQSLSPTDHLAAFYLALQHAVSRQIPEALGYVRQALQLQGDDVHSLHLLALLLSAQKHYHDALNIIEMALSEYPEHFILLFTKVKLESVCRGPDEALLTCKHMLQIWKSCYNLTNPSDSGRGSSLLDRAMADRRQINTMTLPDFSDPETGLHSTVESHFI
ncbi:Tetratricopeptide repeat protein 7B [Acipenser ruthenus]|uniref:Tetratricopeptide repeat protein 7B n=1 Tax=Acipenser ruthenus TaxID=7906 RepID=A0A444UVQ0_ACIRT|nr:Tetratricopeptide repeat protein 7B [Acipenser ruthenus]